MRILLLHSIDNPANLRRTTLNRTFCMPKHLPEHAYTVHSFAHDEREIARQHFDAILIDTTFLCNRWIRPRDLLDKLFERYDFVRQSTAVKIALPQDDYDHCGILDRWLSEWKVDVVFTPLAQFAETLYPQTRRLARIEPALTGYVDPVDRELLRSATRPLSERTIDVGYRARQLPPNFGRVGRLKSEIGRRFIARLPGGHRLNLDISTDPADEILGDRWLDFIGNCRSFLGSVSGSSLLDPDGQIMDEVSAHLALEPHASFDAVEAACFPGEDDRYHMTALGPRNLECAAARTCQILVPDPGLAPFEPDVHYVPLDPDAGNIASVLEALDDDQRLRALTDAAAELVAGSAFALETFVEQMGACLPRGGARRVTAQSIETLTLRERLISTELQRQALEHELCAMRGEVVALQEAVRVRSGVRGALRGALRLLRDPRAIWRQW